MKLGQSNYLIWVGNIDWRSAKLDKKCNIFGAVANLGYTPLKFKQLLVYVGDDIKICEWVFLQIFSIVIEREKTPST